MTAEAEGIRNSHPHVGLPGLVRNVVEVALRIRDLVVDRRRKLAVTDRKRREDRLDGAAGAETVAGGALRRRDRGLARKLLAECQLDHARLGRIAKRR